MRLGLWWRDDCTGCMYSPVHPKRGLVALEELGVLPRFRNILVHDGFKSYAKLECAHALCNAHLLRELTFQAEFRQQDWAKAMIGLLWEVQTFCIMRSHLSTLKKQGGELLPFTGSNLQWG